MKHDDVVVAVLLEKLLHDALAPGVHDDQLLDRGGPEHDAIALGLLDLAHVRDEHAEVGLGEALAAQVDEHGGVELDALALALPEVDLVGHVLGNDDVLGGDDGVCVRHEEVFDALGVDADAHGLLHAAPRELGEDHVRQAHVHLAEHAEHARVQPRRCVGDDLEVRLHDDAHVLGAPLAGHGVLAGGGHRGGGAVAAGHEVHAQGRRVEALALLLAHVDEPEVLELQQQRALRARERVAVVRVPDAAVAEVVEEVEHLLALLDARLAPRERVEVDRDELPHLHVHALEHELVALLRELHLVLVVLLEQVHALALHKRAHGVGERHGGLVLLHEEAQHVVPAVVHVRDDVVHRRLVVRLQLVLGPLPRHLARARERRRQAQAEARRQRHHRHAAAVLAAHDDAQHAQRFERPQGVLEGPPRLLRVRRPLAHRRLRAVHVQQAHDDGARRAAQLREHRAADPAARVQPVQRRRRVREQRLQAQLRPRGRHRRHGGGVLARPRQETLQP
mmetsp:Transcript_10923/g.33240  ORF Transcript_10923/g.33240 Transcript_10923/m.33240 type:complete len:507 (-) Transcript_10923:30-1550(-)